MENPRPFTNVRMPSACFVSTVARRKPLPTKPCVGAGLQPPPRRQIEERIRSWRKKTLLPPDQFYKHLHF
ncbi:hypothetical protein IscW_ISCW002461 [Ixodes scapularis]|uniref:Uncharacterized protein n=1 Tax=Ixodes scapularis TaxID=6945 RepID=B7PAZ3_IXOSC|nr:hypothetical protein IscW_ISCW002461 [Ixodes scapularis]|eukprot:XP_002407482.1 hypothetical protein IscW_ISCW002461 [Ixodes scapularis]